MMKSFILLFISLIALNSESIGQVHSNCSQILAENPDSESGIYTIQPDPGLPPMQCQCDMTTDGGGWTLILNYNHLTNTQPGLNVRTFNLPALSSAGLGTNESGTAFWGHASNTLANSIPFDEVRFYAETSAHSRVINFKTAHEGTVSYFKTGLGSTDGISSSFTPLNGHTANLPAAINMSATDKGDFAMTDYPLWTSSTYHWYLGGQDNFCSASRWEVDDYPCFTVPSTLHQIWVRQNDFVGLNEKGKVEDQLNVWPNPATDMIYVDVSGYLGSQSTLSIYTATGQLMQSEFPVRSPHALNVSELSNGVYTIVLSSDKGLIQQKLIIQE